MSDQPLFVRFIGSSVPIAAPPKPDILSQFASMGNFTPPDSSGISALSKIKAPRKKVIPTALPTPGTTLTVGVVTVDFSYPGEYAGDAPNYIRAICEDDLNITAIHTAVRCVIGSEIHQAPTLRQKYQNLYNTISSQFLTGIESTKISDELRSIYARLEALSSGMKWNEYVKNVRPIFREYLEIATDSVRGVVTFDGKVTQEKKYGPETISRRNELIHAYLDFARAFIRIEVINRVEYVDKCPACDTPAEDFDSESSNGTMMCPCGYQRTGLSKEATYRDSSRVNAAPRAKYDDFTTFMKSFDNYMGVDIPDIPEKLFEMLDTYFKTAGMPQLVGETVKSTEKLLDNGKRSGTSVQILITALDMTNNSSLYSYYNYIGHKYWGWRLPDISQYRERVMRDYNSTQKVYIKTRTRESSLNVQIRLFYHLTICGHVCTQNDFKFLTHRPSLEYHNSQLEMMSKVCGLPIVAII